MIPSAVRLRLRGFEVDLSRGELRTLDGAHVELRPRSFAVLHLLASNVGRLVSKDEIMARVWDDAFVTDDSLTQCIADIRRALGDEERRIVRTVPRRGYLLVPDAMDVHQAPTKLDVDLEPARLASLTPEHGGRRRRFWWRGRWEAAALAIALLIGIAVIVAVFRWSGTGGAPELQARVPDRPSLAVLSFKSVVPSAMNDLFASGVATEIINELARNKDVRVLARDSSFALSGQNLAPREIGSKLRVRYLVDGTVQRLGDTLAIDVQLVDTRDGSVAWGESFKANSELVGQLQPTISSKITAVLHSGLRETEKHAILRRSPKDLDVYELTLRGVALKHQFTTEATRSGRSGLEEAMKRDPNYAPAWLNYAWLNLVDILNQFTGEWSLGQLDDVIAQFNRAIELDPTLPNAYQGLSRAVIFKGDTDQALRLIRRALELGPSDADNLLFFATTVMQSGDLPEAMRAVEAALELNPIRPSYYDRHYAEILWASGSYGRALEHSNECLRKASKFTHCEIFRIASLIRLERRDEAVSLYRQAVMRSSNFDKAILAIMPRPSELGTRYRHDLESIGWRMPG